MTDQTTETAARERVQIMIRTNQGNMTVWSEPEVRDALDAYRDAVHAAASAVSLPPADQTALRDRTAAALYAHDHPSHTVPLNETGMEAAYRETADAVLAVLPATPGRAALVRACASFVRDTYSGEWADDAAATLETDADRIERGEPCSLLRLAAVLPATTRHDTDTSAGPVDRAEYDALVAEADRLRRDGAALHAQAVAVDEQLAVLRQQVAASADRAAVLREAADIAEAQRQFEPAYGARKSAQISENVGILRVADELRRVVDDGSLSPYYEHPECGFHWHGRDGMDVPMRDGQPVCPRCELAKVQKQLAYTQKMRDEVGAECKRRGKRVLEQSERVITLERQVDELQCQLGAEILRAGHAEAELRRVAEETAAIETQAHAPLNEWRVEILDADEWIPASRLHSDRAQAADQFRMASERRPLWSDGTKVQRRLVRETTTYTVEQPAWARQDGAQP